MRPTPEPQMWCAKCAIVPLTPTRVCPNCGTPHGRKPPRPHSPQVPLPAQIPRRYHVILTDPGPRRTSALKIIYEISQLDLKRAKQLCDRAPSIVATFDARDSAEWLREQLLGVGALSIVQENGG